MNARNFCNDTSNCNCVINLQHILFSQSIKIDTRSTGGRKQARCYALSVISCEGSAVRLNQCLSRSFYWLIDNLFCCRSRANKLPSIQTGMGMRMKRCYRRAQWWISFGRWFSYRFILFRNIVAALNCSPIVIDSKRNVIFIHFI